MSETIKLDTNHQRDSHMERMVVESAREDSGNHSWDTLVGMKSRNDWAIAATTCRGTGIRALWVYLFFSPNHLEAPLYTTACPHTSTQETVTINNLMRRL